MELNTTITDGSSVDDYFDTAYSLYATLLKLFFSLLAVPVTTIPILMVILVILCNKELRDLNNLLIVNLLGCDVGFVVVRCFNDVFLIIMYLVGLDTIINCKVVITFFVVSTMVGRLMFLPLGIIWFVCVAFPFTHKRILTTKRITVLLTILWLLGIGLSLIISLKSDLLYIPSLGVCTFYEHSMVSLVAIVAPVFVSASLVGISSLYLRHKMIRSNRFIHGIRRSVAEEEKVVRLGRLVDILREQLEPTLAVFIVGGVDVLLNLVFAIVLGVALYYYSPKALILVYEFVLVPLRFFQCLCHSLTFGLYKKEIRDKMCSGTDLCPKRSRVVVLSDVNGH